MRFLTSTTFAFLAILISQGTAYPTLSSSSLGLTARSPSYSVEVVYEFPKGTWVENLAIRANDQILADLLSTPEIYQIDPAGAHPPQLIHKFTETTGVLGIAELFPDIFYVVTGNYSFATFTPTPGSWQVWSINMNSYQLGGKIPAIVKKVADLPGANFLNGATALDFPGLMVIADSGLGAVWRVNVLTGEVIKIIQDPTMAPAATVPAVGINGVKVLNGFLYFTNTNSDNFVRIPIHRDGTAAGSAEIVASGIAGFDDFIFDKYGDAFFALDTENELGELLAGQTAPKILAGSPSLETIPGPTALRFGRGKLDKETLYISTNGGIAGYETGNFAAGGGILKVAVGVPGY